MFEPDEYLFAKLAYYFKRKKKEKQENIARAVKLDDLKQRLTILHEQLQVYPLKYLKQNEKEDTKTIVFFFQVEWISSLQ